MITPGEILESLRSAGAAISAAAVGALRQCYSSYFGVLRYTYHATGGNAAGIFPIDRNPPREVGFWESILTSCAGSSILGLIGSVIANSCRSVAQISSKITNTMLHTDDRIDMPEDNRNWKFKYIAGFPGAALGAIIGVAGWVGAGIGRTLSNSWTAFKDVSGGIINATLERQLFKGLANERDHRKSFGFPGAVAAILTTGLVAAAYTLAFKVALPLAGSAISLAVAPICRLIHEGGKALTDQLRFSGTLNQTQQRLKNLFTSLNAAGKFSVGTTVKQAQESAHYTHGLCKNIWKLLRKSITFNTQTLTERLLTAIAENLGAGQDIVNAVDAAKKAVQKHYKDQSHWFTPDSEKALIIEEIGNISTFVQGYLERGGPREQIPDNLYRKSQTATLFLSKFAEGPGNHEAYQPMPDAESATIEPATT